jgi:sugar phosphate isomerase/epimerase
MRVLTRRDFLSHAGIFAASAAGLSGSPISVRAAETERKSPRFPVVLFTKVCQELNLGLEDTASLIAEAGLDGVDSPVRPKGEILPEKVKDDLPRYAEALRERGLSLPLLTTAILSPDSPHAEDILRTSKKAGVRFYRTGFIDRLKDKPLHAQIAEARARLKDLAAMNREIGIGAIVQNHSPAGHAYLGGDLNELEQLVAGFDPNQVGAAFDIGHAVKVHGKDWRQHFEKLKSHLKVAYVKDTNSAGEWVRFGKGEIGDLGYFKLLREIGYEAPLSMHIEFDWSKNDQKSRGALLLALKDCLGVLRGWLNEAATADSGAKK